MPPPSRGLNAEGLLGIFYVLDFGATGDGQHDDSGGIQGAILAAGSAGGGLVAIPAGTYRLGSNVGWGNAANVTIWQHSGAAFTGPGGLPAAAGSNAIRAEPSAATIGGVPVNQAFGDVAAAGATGVAADSAHRHGMPGNPVGGGTIGTANLAANAVTQAGSADGVTASPTTTSTTYIDLPEIVVTLTTTGGDLLCWLSAVFAETTGGPSDVLNLALSLDAAAEVGVVGSMGSIANQQLGSSTVQRFVAPAAGAHTVKGRWKVSAGTFTATGTQRHLLVEEVKR